MSNIGKHLQHRDVPLFSDTNNSNSSSSSTSEGGEHSSSNASFQSQDSRSHHSPTIEDVFEVKELFTKVKKLPIELVDIILDVAEYWPHTTVETRSSSTARGGSPSENTIVLRSFPLGYVPRAIDIDNPTTPNRIYPSTRQLNPLFADNPGKDNQRPIRKYLPSQDAYRSDVRKWPREDSQETGTSDSTTRLLESWAMKSATRVEHPCRKIVFTIKSHDQAYSGPQSGRLYQDSNTWFDTGLERIEVDAKLREQTFNMTYGTTPPSKDGSSSEDNVDDGQDVPCVLRTYEPAGDHDKLVDDTQERLYDHPFRPHPTTLQINRLAGRIPQEPIIIEWRYNDNFGEQELKDIGRGELTGNGEFVSSLKVGDVVTVWARARYAGWVNYVKEVKMDVYWAV